ncbi:MAG: aspartate ammonia-lyase [Armatimonadetes bacterium]|nr:aspartate ammonia-lyase [Armatimonadota bacterium]
MPTQSQDELQRDVRVESDLLGSLEVPADVYWGIHTLRSSRVFHLAGEGLHPELIRALALVKKACALANKRVGLLSAEKADAIAAAAEDVASGQLHDQFLTDALQGGAGTSANMNMNEVLANRAIERLGGALGDYSVIHPLDDVNLSQSTNDVFPTAVRVAGLWLLDGVMQAITDLQDALRQKEVEFADVLKIGRTEMQDAVPVTLGQEFGAWAEAVKRDWWRLNNVGERLRQVNLGGTAVGTGINANTHYIYIASDILRDLTGLPIVRSENMVDVTQNCDVFAEISGLIKSAAVNLMKISADLRLLSSGPRAGFAEIGLPEIQAGSSIMPGKVNPVIPEAVAQAAIQIQACDLAITLAAQNGQLELNAFVPAMAHNLMRCLDLLRGAAKLFSDHCIRGIVANRQRCEKFAEGALSLATALTGHIGYEKATEVAREAGLQGRSVREVALERGYLTEEELARILSPGQMTRPGTPGRQTHADGPPVSPYKEH